MKRGEFIRKNDKFWHSNVGPWTVETGDNHATQIGRAYIPDSDFFKVGTFHVLYIRKVTRK